MILKNIAAFAVTLNSIDIDGNGKPRSVTIQIGYSISVYDYVANESPEVQFWLGQKALEVVSLSQPPNAPNGGAVANLKYTLPYSVFHSNSETVNVELAEMPAGSVILASKISVTESFDSGAISFSSGVGSNGNSFNWLLVDQCQATAGASENTTSTGQTVPVYLENSPLDFGVTLTGPLPLSGLTTGSVTVWVSYLVQN